MKKEGMNRRQFLYNSTMLGASGLVFLNVPYLFAASGAAVGKTLSIAHDRKALVFIMLDGGNDAYNMLVPVSNPHYTEYTATRGNLALNRDELLPLDYQDKDGRRFGLHPACGGIGRLFNTGKLSFAANIGPMVEPLNKERFFNGARVPLGLLSHADQFNHWQTGRADMRLNRGWFGHMADALQSNLRLSDIPMNISLSGSNIMQNGALSSQYAITEKGSVGMAVKEADHPLNLLIMENFEKIMSHSATEDFFSTTYLQQTRAAQKQHRVFKSGTESVTIKGNFSDHILSRQLAKVAQTIAAGERLGHGQQTFFIRYIGWDHHDELLHSQAEMLGVVSNALEEFQGALESMGLADKVVTFTGSDFGRTLTSNGNGTDHGWGGISMVMGQPVAGGQVAGRYPQLSLGENNPLDIGNGVLIPTTPSEILFAELAGWFGVKKDDYTTLFPNLRNFSNGSFTPLDIIRG